MPETAVSLSSEIRPVISVRRQRFQTSSVPAEDYCFAVSAAFDTPRKQKERCLGSPLVLSTWRCVGAGANFRLDVKVNHAQRRVARETHTLFTIPGGRPSGVVLPAAVSKQGKPLPYPRVASV